MSSSVIENLFSIAGKTALVTGGSRGIGLMIARAYVEAGAKVYISSRKAEVCDRVAKEIGAVSLPADLSSVDECRRLAAELAARESKLDILVNNAGASWGAKLEDFPEHGFDKTMDTNVKAIFYLTQQLLPLLEKAARPGAPARVINIGSIDGIRVPEFDNFPYAASKAAVHHLTRVLAVRLGASNITVNAIAPGLFESKMTEWLIANFRDSIVEACPLKRMGEPADMAGVAIYLASPASAYVNGAVIPVDGGTCLK